MIHKKALLTWLAIYPLVTLMSWSFGEMLINLALPIRTLILSLVLVPIMSYVVMPFYGKIFYNWVNKNRTNKEYCDAGSKSKNY